MRQDDFLDRDVHRDVPDGEGAAASLLERRSTMQMSPYRSFTGQCEEAFTYYVSCLDGTLGPLFRYEESPMAETAPAGWSEKIMHGSVTVGGVLLMGADIAPEQHEKPQGFHSRSRSTASPTPSASSPGWPRAAGS